MNDFITCNLIVEETGRILGIFDLPQHMGKLAWVSGSVQLVVGEIHMHGEKSATVFLVAGSVEVENRRTSDDNHLPYVNIWNVPAVNKDTRTVKEWASDHDRLLADLRDSVDKL